MQIVTDFRLGITTFSPVYYRLTNLMIVVDLLLDTNLVRSLLERQLMYSLFFDAFFFFFGEFLLLVLFNFNTISDTIPSSYFLSTKNHVIFWLNVEGKLGEVIMIYICIFSFCSLNFLLRLDIDCSYNRVYRQGGVDAIFSNSIFVLVQFH
jgi:hypothetical protein